MASAETPRLRFATPDDAAALSALAARSFRDAFGADNSAEDMQQFLSTSLTLATTQQELADSSKIFLIVERDSLLGYAMLSMATSEACITADPSMEIERIYVDDAAVGTGVGKALMQACIEQAANHDCQTIWLGVWEKNQRAIRFYERWHFEIVGKRKFQLGSDPQNDLLMSRPVDVLLG